MRTVYEISMCEMACWDRCVSHDNDRVKLSTSCEKIDPFTGVAFILVTVLQTHYQIMFAF